MCYPFKEKVELTKLVLYKSSKISQCVLKNIQI
jgi:hypothetical protein